MKVNMEFIGLPVVSDILDKKKIEVDISGQTVENVIDELIRRYGKKLKEALYPGGTFDLMIQIALNGKYFIPTYNRDTCLHDADTLMFMLLLPGG